MSNRLLVSRSQRREVRNPVLGLPAARLLQAQSPEIRAVLRQLFLELSADCRARAQASWLKNKGPMAAYWKACGAYCTHISRVLR